MLDRMRARPATLDSDVIARLYQAYIDAVFDYCLFRTADEAAAEELTADSFTRAWTARARYQPERSDFAGWRFTIARRVVIDWQRSRKRHPMVLLAPLTPDTGALPEALAEAGAHQAQLRQLVQALPRGDQEIIALKFGADMTKREMAAFFSAVRVPLAARSTERWVSCAASMRRSMNNQDWKKSSNAAKVLAEFDGPDQALARQLLALRPRPAHTLHSRTSTLQAVASAEGEPRPPARS